MLVVVVVVVVAAWAKAQLAERRHAESSRGCGVAGVARCTGHMSCHMLAHCGGDVVATVAVGFIGVR